MRILVFFLIGGLLFPACGNEAQKQKEALLAEVMAAHDEVMPKMGELRRTAKALQALADSLESTGMADSLQLVTYREAAKKIEEANESMMEWMRQFESPDNEAPIEEVIAYLKEQKDKIDKVREDMLKSLEEGQALQ